MMDIYRVLGWLVPGVCLIGAASSIYSKRADFDTATLAGHKADNDYTVATATKAQVDRQPTERRYAAAGSGPLEETQFLDDLRQRAHRTGAILASWTSRATVYGDHNTAGPGDEPGKAQLVKGVTRVDCDLTLSGTYASIRSFLKDLSDSDRLFTMKNVNWSRNQPGGTSLSMSLGRYVAPADTTSANPTKA